MANVFVVSHISLLFHLPKGSWNKSAKYEKLGKYWPYCTRNRAITNAYALWESDEYTHSPTLSNTQASSVIVFQYQE